MAFEDYLSGLQAILERIRVEQGSAIRRAGDLVASALSAGGIIHAFGTGHSHLIAEEAFFRAGGLTAVNPILDARLIFLKGALESTRAERETGLAQTLLMAEIVRPEDVGVVISNSGRNAVPIEMALEMKARDLPVIVITNLKQSEASLSRHSSGKRLFELADVAIDNCTPPGDALLALEGLQTRIGPASTVAGVAIMNSIVIEAANILLRRGETVPVLPSANVEGTTTATLGDLLAPYRDRIRYLDLDTTDLTGGQ